MFQCSVPLVEPSLFPDPLRDVEAKTNPQSAVLAGGCFWCVEAIFGRISGVLSAVSGYAGGVAETANYNAVCSGVTNHAEVVKIEYDSSLTSFGQILKVFFSIAHDPTQVNRQGNDIGTQYRSAIFFVDDEQLLVAESYIKQLNEAKVYSSPIVTKLELFLEFFEAESYHQKYAENNPKQPYITHIAVPKLDKLEIQFPTILKNL